MAIVHVCDTCDERMENDYYIISTGRYDKSCYLGDDEHERYEICPNCFDLIKTFLACMRSNSDTLMNIIEGDSHDES